MIWNNNKPRGMGQQPNPKLWGTNQPNMYEITTKHKRYGTTISLRKYMK